MLLCTCLYIELQTTFGYLQDPCFPELTSEADPGIGTRRATSKLGTWVDQYFVWHNWRWKMHVFVKNYAKVATVWKSYF